MARRFRRAILRACGLLSLAAAGCSSTNLPASAEAAPPGAPAKAAQSGGVTLPYPSVPWEFDSMGFYATGLALADINGDGFKDVVMSAGNDMALQSVVVYYNDGKGKFPKRPSWSSGDMDYNTGLAVGDINGDGRIDVAVSVGLGARADLGGGRVKVYFNEEGQLAKLPGYESGDRYSSFGCALGDADGDGDLDLAVGSMVEGGKASGSVRIYTNNAGVLEAMPRWKSSDMSLAGGVLFADLNDDGFLDLAVAASKSKVYSASAGADGAVHLATEPSWISGDESYTALFLDAGRIGGANLPAIAVSYNDVCYKLKTPCGLSRFEAYNASDASPIWRSRDGGLGSGVLLADVNGDGRVDLLTGRWGVEKVSGAPLQIYLGTDAGLASEPAFTSGTSSKIETIAAADLVRAPPLWREVSESFAVTSPRAVVSLSRQVIEEVKEVRKNGKVLGNKEYATVPGRNIVSFAERLKPGDDVRVTYACSDALDIVVANFNPEIGDYIFYSSLHSIATAVQTTIHKEYP